MTVQRHDHPRPRVERTFTAVRAALPAECVPEFDSHLQAIAGAPVVDLATLDEHLAAWHRIAVRFTADPDGWARMLQAADEIRSGARPLGPPLAEVLARHGARL
jgi:Family of unknown function (DUF6247)